MLDQLKISGREFTLHNPNLQDLAAGFFLDAHYKDRLLQVWSITGIHSASALELAIVRFGPSDKTEYAETPNYLLLVTDCKEYFDPMLLTRFDPLANLTEQLFIPEDGIQLVVEQDASKAIASIKKLHQRVAPAFFGEHLPKGSENMVENYFNNP